MDKQKDKTSFAERHPGWNRFLGILLLLIGLAIGIFIVFLVLKYFGIGIVVFLDWIKNITSKFDAVVIVALLTGSISLISVIISSIVAKLIGYRKSREEYLAQKREKSYEAFIAMVYKIQNNGKKPGTYTEDQMVKDILSFSEELTLWGSEKVAKKWVEFRLKGASPDYGMDNIFLMESIMNEMRHDMGLKRLKKGKLLSFFVNDIKQR